MTDLLVDPENSDNGWLSPEELAGAIKLHLPHIRHEDALEIAKVLKPIIDMVEPVQDYAQVLYEKHSWMNEVQSVEQAKLAIKALADHERAGGLTSAFYPASETNPRKMIVINAVPDTLPRRLSDEAD